MVLSVYVICYYFNYNNTFVIIKNITKTAQLRDMILGNEKKDIPMFINMLFIDPEILERGWITFAKYADKKLSFTDCSIIELIFPEKILIFIGSSMCNQVTGNAWLFDRIHRIYRILMLHCILSIL